MPRRGQLMAQRPRQETTDSLFEDLRSTGNPAARSALIEQHLPLARSLAGRYRYTPQALEDLEQVASLALVKAVDRFDPERGAPFAAFAVPTILGELKRHMRDATWAVHVPRALKERVLAVERAERTLSNRLGGAPTAQQLAAEAGLSTEEVLEALNARVAHDALPLDLAGSAPFDTAPSPDAAALAVPDDFREAVEDRLALSGALRGLQHRERTILRLRFVEGLTQTEIAQRVGLSQMYVSRLLRASLEQLRAEID
jgi:RNA polymerase sigma-B factor